jgi:hypothetical protein
MTIYFIRIIYRIKIRNITYDRKYYLKDLSTEHEVAGKIIAICVAIHTTSQNII